MSPPFSSGLLFAVGLRLSLSNRWSLWLSCGRDSSKGHSLRCARGKAGSNLGASYNGSLRAGTRSSDVPMSRRSWDARLKRETERRENRIAGNPVLGRELTKPSRAESDLLLARLECVREDRTD
jgi:hypothetical protein